MSRSKSAVMVMVVGFGLASAGASFAREGDFQKENREQARDIASTKQKAQKQDCAAMKDSASYSACVQAAGSATQAPDESRQDVARRDDSWKLRTRGMQ